MRLLGRTFGRGASRFSVGLMTSAALLAGCGGPSVETFTEQANAICTDHAATIEAAASEVLAGGQLPSPEEFGRLAQETIIPELTAQFEELRDVEPPAELAAEYEAFLTTGEETLDELRADPSILTDATNFEEANGQADAAGLSGACHMGPG